MYICERCGEIFDSPEVEIWRDVEEFWGAKCYNETATYSCPFCGSEDIEPYYEDDEEETEEDRIFGRRCVG